MSTPAVIQACTVLLPPLYLLAALLHGMEMGGPGAPQVARWRRIAFGLALLVHVALFVARWTSSDGFPVSDNWASISAGALGVALLYAWISYRSRRHETGVVVLGFVFVLQALASAFGPLEVTDGDDSLVVVIHIASSLIAFATLGLSGIHGLLYVVVFQRMKQHEFGPFLRHMPALEELIAMTRRAAFAGFLLLAVGVNAGIGWAHAEGVEGFSYGHPLVLVMIAVWVHFGIIAFSGSIPRVNARHASIAAAIGFAAMILSLVVATTQAFHGGG